MSYEHKEIEQLLIQIVIELRRANELKAIQMGIIENDNKRVNKTS